MSIEKIEQAILASGAVLLGIFICQFCLLNFNQVYSRFWLEWVLDVTVVIEGIVSVVGIVSLFSWVYFEITHLNTHHWRMK